MRIANRTAARAGVATVAAGVLAAGAFTLVSSAGASPSRTAGAQVMGTHAAAGHVSYGFRTLDDSADPTFNQLLGINDNGLIAGYFGGSRGYDGSETGTEFPRFPQSPSDSPRAAAFAD